MGREIKRVALDFDAPKDETWKGYVTPDELCGDTCSACEGGGWSPMAKHLQALWYGNAPFSPEEHGTTPLTPETPAVRWFATRNVEHSPEYYGTDAGAIYREGLRLCGFWNASWGHHLNEDDIAIVLREHPATFHDLTHDRVDGEWVAKEPQIIPTPDQVADYAIRNPFGLSSSTLYALQKERCKQAGTTYTCDQCDGQGSLWRDAEHKAAYDAWEPYEPPRGEGWQLWQTVSDAPLSPVFPDAEGLIGWLQTGDACWGAMKEPWTREEAERFRPRCWRLPDGHP